MQIVEKLNVLVARNLTGGIWIKLVGNVNVLRSINLLGKMVILVNHVLLMGLNVS